MTFLESLFESSSSTVSAAAAQHHLHSSHHHHHTPAALAFEIDAAISSAIGSADDADAHRWHVAQQQPPPSPSPVSLLGGGGEYREERGDGDWWGEACDDIDEWRCMESGALSVPFSPPRLDEPVGPPHDKVNEWNQVTDSDSMPYDEWSEPTQQPDTPQTVELAPQQATFSMPMQPRPASEHAPTRTLHTHSSSSSASSSSSSPNSNSPVQTTTNAFFGQPQSHAMRPRNFGDMPPPLLPPLPHGALAYVQSLGTVYVADPIHPVSVAPASGVALKACKACRKLKAACDDQRPCTRCVKFCRTCEDRTEEEVEAAIARRRRIGTGMNRAKGGQSNKKRASTKKTTPKPAAGVTASSAATPDPHPLNPESYRLSSAATESAARQLYSQANLAVMREVGVRDSILTMHARLESMPLRLSSLLHWHTQVHFCMLHLSDSMKPDDFLAFLTDGLTQAQLESHAWTSSPLAAWTSLSTRPIHYAVQPSTADTDSESAEDFIYPPRAASSTSAFEVGLTPPGVDSSSGSESAFSPNAHPTEFDVDVDFLLGDPHAAESLPAATQMHLFAPMAHTQPQTVVPSAQLQIQWLPASNRAYQAWQRNLASRLMFERHVRASQCPLLPGACPLRDRLPLPAEVLSAVIGNGGFLPEDATTEARLPKPASEGDPSLLDRARALIEDLNRASRSPHLELESAVRNSGNSILPMMRVSPDADVEEILEQIACLDIGRSLAAEPPIERGGDAVSNVHSTWCPLANRTGGVTDFAAESAAHHAKRSRMPGMEDVHGHVINSHSSSVGGCTCSMSTPLPIRIRVNSAFTSFFGRGLSDAQEGFALEGMSFMRKLYPPSQWPVIIREQMQHLTMLLDFVGQATLHVTLASIGIDEAPPIPPPERPEFRPFLETEVITAAGIITRARLRKCPVLQHSDGTKTSAIVLAWDID